MNYYEVLGISKNATQKDIKKAYKNLVKKYHPDIYQGDKTYAEKRTSEINVAYDTLSNPDLKLAYDEEHFPKTNSSYTPSEYNPTNENYNKTYNEHYQTYDEYKHNYTYSSYTATNIRDGSERDYSTYVNYGNPNTNFHRSRTSNSNYTYKTEPFKDKIFSKFDKFSSKNKQKTFIIIILLYLIVLIYFIFQLINLFTNTDLFKTDTPFDTTTNPSVIENVTIPDITSKTEKDVDDTNLIINNTTNGNNLDINVENNSNSVTIDKSNTVPNNNSNTDFNIYNIYTENELQSLYQNLTSEYNEEITYEEFLEYLTQYFSIFLGPYQ